MACKKWRLAEKARVNLDEARYIRYEDEGTEFGAVACVAMGSEHADLIVTAPELLAALQACVLELEFHAGAASYAEIQMAKRAIAKAEGR